MAQQIEIIDREPTREELAEFDRMDAVEKPENVAPVEVIELGNY